MCAERSHANCGQSTGRGVVQQYRCIHNRNNDIHYRKYIQIYSPMSRRYVTLPSTFLSFHPFTNVRLHIVNPIFKITLFVPICEISKSPLIRSFCVEKSIYERFGLVRIFLVFFTKHKQFKHLKPHLQLWQQQLN